MADNAQAEAVATGGLTFATDEIAGTPNVHYPLTKIVWGPLDTINVVDTAAGKAFPVTLYSPLGQSVIDDTNDAVKVVQATAANLNVTVGNATLAVTQSGTWTLGANSGVDIGDVDVTSFPTTVHSADFDTGAGTDTTLTFGLAVPASGGAAVVPGNATAGLKVDLGADNDVTVTGSVNANAGTNLNTSALALETGGNLASAVTALQLIDDSIFADNAVFNLGSSKTTVAGVIRDDALTALLAAEGDVVPLRVNSTGALHVTGGGGGTEYNEDDVAPAPIVGTATLMERDDVLATLTPIEGDFAAFRCNARGALWVEHDTTTAIPVTDNGGNLSVDWAGTVPPIGAGTEAAALRVTMATNSTGVLSVDDNGTSLTVDGTVTANLSATDNAVLDQIEVNTSYGDNTGGGTEAGALRVTLANDSTGLVSVDATQLDIDDLAATADNVGAALMTNVIHNGATALTPKFAKIDAATAGDNTIVAAVTGKKIRVLQLFLVSAGTVIVRFESGAAGTALTGQMNLVVNSGFTLPFSPVGWFESASGVLLNLELSAAVSVDGAITYIEV